MNNQSAEIKSETIGFKSTGALAAAADFTIQLVRDKQKEIIAAENGTATDYVNLGLIVQKSRHGRGGVVQIDFDITKGLIRVTSLRRLKA